MKHEFQVLDGGRAGEPRPRTQTREAVNSEQSLQFDLLAEASLLSCIVADESMLDEVRGWLREEHFYSESYKRIYRALCVLRDRGTPIDSTSLLTQLRESDDLQTVGGAKVVMETITTAPMLSTARVREYARSVRDKWVRRSWRATAHLSRDRAELEVTDIAQILEDARADADRFTEELARSDKSALLHDVLVRTAKRLESMKSTGGVGELPSGFDAFDRLISGLQNTLMIVAARPGMGKTSFATRVAVNVASRLSADGKHLDGVWMASQETFDEEACTRLWCAEAKVYLARARTGMLTSDDWTKLATTVKHLDAIPFWLDDEPAQTTTALWTKCRRANSMLRKRGGKLRLVIVDYLQLMKAPRPNMKREEAVSENARMLLAMCSDLQCGVLALAQLNRQCEGRQDKRPMLSDLRESGELEQAARIVAFLYRDEYYNKNSEHRGIAELIVAKQNNGPTDTVRLRFDAPYTRFDNLEDDSGSSSTTPPPGFYDTPTPTSPEEAKTKKRIREDIQRVLSVIGAGTDIMSLYKIMAEKHGLEWKEVEAIVTSAHAAGMVRIEGDGTGRKLSKS